MNKPAIALLLASMCCTAFAEWIPLGETKTMAVYYDRTRIKKTGVITAVWALFDLKKDAHMRYKSMMQLIEFKCGDDTSRLRYVATYGESGNSLSTEGREPPFEPIVPGSITDGLAKSACNRAR
jgi:hypothetical protein